MPSPISPLDSLAILAVTLVSGVVSELVSWYLVYRTQAFKDLKSKIERESRKRTSCVWISTFVVVLLCVSWCEMLEAWARVFIEMH